eukprot:TRINITY_DN20940_c0_g1_i1.p1 TRINITY_DN20940_c0_g1~~TRINITY_DN20940_c0_g1_i1.p1  ORF type:complete len:424 (+),score=69.81 TRINITY_DN20940_c0_g1_i1:49-1320(+)
MSPNKKEVIIDFWGVKRSLGVITASLITDLISIVNAKKRKRGRHRLSEERLMAVQNELSRNTIYQTITDLEDQISKWHEEHKQNFNADTHYNERRAAAYTEWNGGSQLVQTIRCLELAGIVNPQSEQGSYNLCKTGKQRRDGTEADQQNRRQTLDMLSKISTKQAGTLILDAGCGSGLSSDVLHAVGFTVVGMDYSHAMLKLLSSTLPTMCVARSDIRQQLPFRGGLFRHIFSVGALHFLDTQQDAQTFFSDAHRLLDHDESMITASFFPKDITHARMIRDAARDSGFDATCVLDRPHRTAVTRWFFLATSGYKDSTSLQSCPSCSMFDFRAPCPLSVSKSRDIALSYEADSHNNFLLREHIKHAKRIVRTAKYQMSESGPCSDPLDDRQLSIASKLREAFPNGIDDENSMEIIDILHPLQSG